MSCKCQNDIYHIRGYCRPFMYAIVGQLWVPFSRMIKLLMFFVYLYSLSVLFFLFWINCTDSAILVYWTPAAAERVLWIVFDRPSFHLFILPSVCLDVFGNSINYISRRKLWNSLIFSILTQIHENSKLIWNFCRWYF